MKLTTIIFILLASSTYRCLDDDRIDCSLVANEMIGEWVGELNYERPSSANGKKHTKTLIIQSSNDCSFYGFSKYNESDNTFRISGYIDIYGWVEFIEEDFIYNGGEYSGLIPWIRQ